MKSSDDIAALIDYTLLKPDATEGDISDLCHEARKYGFAAVCVNPVWVSLCQRLLQGTRVRVGTVIGFPLGAIPTQAKVEETVQAIIEGADELDVVMNIGFFKSGREAEVEEDIRQVVQAASGKTVKVIIEIALLTDGEKARACKLAHNAGAHFVKTSTGFFGGGATERDVALIRQVVGDTLGVKASGGIRTAEAARKMLAAGATRIGTSAGIAIVTGGETNR